MNTPILAVVTVREFRRATDAERRASVDFDITALHVVP